MAARKAVRRVSPSQKGVALALRPTDPMALHYRHLGALVARQLQRGGEIDAVLLVIRDAGKRGLFGGKSQDPTLAQARVPWSQLSDANLETREFALALTDDGGAETGATLWVRANHANLSRYLAEVTSL